MVERGRGGAHPSKRPANGFSKEGEKDAISAVVTVEKENCEQETNSLKEKLRSEGRTLQRF